MGDNRGRGYYGGSGGYSSPDRGSFRGGDRRGTGQGDRGGYGGGGRSGYGGPGGSPRGGDRGGYGGGGRAGYGGPGGSPGRGYRGNSPGRGFRGSPGRGGYPGDQNVPMPESAPHDILGKQLLQPGTNGRQISLIANFYKLNKTTDVTIYHYDVAIKIKNGKANLSSSSEEKCKSNSSGSSDAFSDELPITTKELLFIKKFSPDIFKKFTDNRQDKFGGVHYVYDGFKNLYTSTLLSPFVPNVEEVKITVDNREKVFWIKLKKAGEVAMNTDLYSGAKPTKKMSKRAISVYETMFRYLCSQKYQGFQRKFADFDTAQSLPNLYVDFVQGFTSAVRLTEFGPAFNPHLKTSCIIRRDLKLTDLAEMIGQIKQGTTPNRSQIVDVNKIIRHLKMFTTHGERERTYTIDCIMKEFPHQMNFQRDNNQVTIGDYFKATYRIDALQWPLVKTTGKISRYIPMELCFLSPSQFLSNAKINIAIQRELLLKSTHTPNVMFNKLDKIVKTVAATEPALQDGFGVTLDTRPVAFQGRVLDTPLQQCSNNRDKFYSIEQPPKRWAVFCFDSHVDKDQLKVFVDQMVERARFFGLNFDKPNPISIVKISDSNSISNAFYNLHKKTNAEFVFVGIPNRNFGLAPSHVYALTKHYCDQKYGIMSQCFSVEKMLQTPHGYFENFLQKTNGKIGGLNSVLTQDMVHSLPFKMERTMMIGIDVNHPSETERISTSISVAVGSLDSMYSKYAASIRVQKKDRDEIVGKLTEMIAELLEEFRKIHNVYPVNLIIFRDGVSEGQFKMIENAELPSIEAATKELGIQTKITLIVTQKNHNTRFALTQVDARGRRPTWNVPSGTVVDTTIVQPKYQMFYLNSHFSPLGTSRSTKYVIIHDDLNMTADQVQRMTFLACFHSIRTRGVLAIPTPTRYADLCAYRSKLHIEAQRDKVDQFIKNQKDQEFFETNIIRELNVRIKVNDNLKNKLFYC